MADEPILLLAPSRAREIELAAMRAYRAAHPGGPPWLGLVIETRHLWLSKAEADYPTSQGTEPRKTEP